MNLPVPAAIPGALASTDAEAQVLVWCEAALDSLQHASSFTEAKNVRDFASTLEHAARLKNLNDEAAKAASTLAVRARQCMGKFMLAAEESGELAKRGNPRLRSVSQMSTRTTFTEQPVKLAELGISRDEAAAIKRLASAPDEKFEEAIAVVTKETVRNVTTTAVLRHLDPEGEKRPDERWLDAEKFTAAAKRLLDLREKTVAAASFGIYPGDFPDLVGNGIKRTLTSAREAITDVLRAIERQERNRSARPQR